MAMILCSSRLAAVDVTYDCVKSSVGTVGSPYRSSWGFPPVSASFRHRFARLHAIDFPRRFGVSALSALSAGLFSQCRRRAAHGARDEAAAKR